MRTVHFAAIGVALLVTLSILLLDPILRAIPLLPDAGPSWYYWKLPEQTTMGQITAWGFYALHQLFFWGLILWAQKNRELLRNRGKMHMVNWVGLFGMLAFAGLHYLQTAIWYDGLAQDTSVFSSQGSVILLLVVVLMIEAPRRGLFFGHGGGWLRSIRPFLVRYHGYYFAWAVTYTYWFHPMETTMGHLWGFFYTFLLMIQGAFVFTRVHTNKYWTVTLEVMVLIHGTIVAVTGGQEFWPMFFFGFLAMFVVTQMHGLGLSRLVRGVIAAASVIGVIVVYSSRGWGNLNEVARIPVIDYALVFVLSGLVWLGLRLVKGPAAKA